MQQLLPAELAGLIYTVNSGAGTISANLSAIIRDIGTAVPGPEFRRQARDDDWTLLLSFFPREWNELAVSSPTMHSMPTGCWQRSKNRGAMAVIPARRNRTARRHHDREMYRWRNQIENYLARIKEFRSIATRYDKSFAAAIISSVAWLRQHDCQQALI